MIDEPAIVDPPSFSGNTPEEPEKDLLSIIIDEINSVYGVNITEEDKVNLDRLKSRLTDSGEIKKYMEGDNSVENKKNYFQQQFNDAMLDYVNDRFDFYKKMEDNKDMKNMIFQNMYADYLKNNMTDQ